MKKQFLETDFGFTPIFYLLDLNRNELKSIAVEKVDEIGFYGLSFKEHNLGWSINPIKIGRGFISLGEFDFTENFEEAKNHAATDQSDNIIRTYDGDDLS